MSSGLVFDVLFAVLLVASGEFAAGGSAFEVDMDVVAVVVEGVDILINVI